MAVSKWLMRKSFEEANAKAQVIKEARAAKNERNSGLFTAAQEDLRRELRLHDRLRPHDTGHDCCECMNEKPVFKASRSRSRIVLKRK
ncbi:MAG: hypothetical protein WCK79_03680 [Actinomycetes bacterium]